MGANAEGKDRILVMASTFPRWQRDSQPRFVLDLCKQLNRKYDITVVAPHCQGALRREKIEGIEVVRFKYAPHCLEGLAYDGGMLNRLRQKPVRALLLPAFFIAMFMATLKIAKKNDTKLLHAHWLVPQGIVAVLVKKFLFKRSMNLVVTSHGVDLYSLKGKLWENIKKWVIRNSDMITVVSTQMKGKILQFEPDSKNKIKVAPMGADLQFLFRPAPKKTKRNEPLIVFVGRLVEKKGVCYLIRALIEVRAIFPNAKLCIVGDGPLRRDLECLSKELKLQEAVQFAGAVQQIDLPDYYRSAHICVFPFVETKSGDQEGLGLVVVEAMGCGSPVIATSIDALQDTVLDNKAAKLCQPKSSRSLADTIVAMLKEDLDDLKLFTDINRSFVVENFDWSRAADKYIAIFNDFAEKQ